MTYKSCFEKAFLISTFLLSCIALNAQVMWNLKGGFMPTTTHHIDEDTEHKMNWMLGLEMEIPLNQKLNLETGLRYKNETACWGDDYSDRDHTVNHLELPIRCTYKYKLRENLLLRAGIGPYLGVGLQGDGVRPKIGIEPSIAVDWKCLSLGLTYNKPYYIAERGKYEANSGLMLTLGIRFKSRAWKYIGAGVLAAGAVAGTVYAVTQVNHTSSNSSSDISSSDYSSSNSSYNDQGIKSRADSKICQWCKGSGICKFCKGSGQSVMTNIGTNVHMPCSYCHGKKYCTYCRDKKTTRTTQRSTNTGANCRDCGGSAMCGECAGNGWKYDSLGKVTTCWRCNGDRKCKTCKGTGTR